ncbi:S66 family peptidase [Halosimplex pelagicum]|uniref:LD-carboxypeptidase n=1 Tax=Halosimplex pelagicum TaxID=869886 RepID=A0A7D5PE50_9EURY|nr:S66 peptidase family protein [Halosimplex pelagicum]QLH84742.1 LD-carboxypeptidase [Halosimplex pelagicum]
MSDGDDRSPEFVTPPPAEPGDRVAVIAPSGGAATLFPDVLDLALERLRDRFDLDPVVFGTAEADPGELRERPEMRAADVHEAFRDPEISAAFATIGGDDQVRVLRHLDPDILRANPTRFFGMSDNTCLASYLWTHGVVSCYGGQLLNQVATPGSFPEYTERYLRRALFEESLGELEPAEAWTDDTVEWGRDDFRETEPAYEANEGWRWDVPDAREGEEISGRLWGGCLTVLPWLLAADRAVPDPADLDGAVLALETSEELPSAEDVRRKLTVLGERGLLERFDAVLVGRPQTRSRESDRTDEERTEYRENQRAAVSEWVREYNTGAPVVFDLDFGHTNPTAPVPMGGRVAVDTDERSVRFP